MYFRVFAFWRLIAAIAIMVYHFAHYGPVGHEFLIRRLELMAPLLDMFFIISGVLIFARYRESISPPAVYAGYLYRRFVRIAPLHLATMAFFVAGTIAGRMGAFRVEGHPHFTLVDFWPNLFLLQGWGVAPTLTLNYVSWSLSAEWFCYIFLPVIAVVWKYAGTRGLAALFMAWVLALEALSFTGVAPFRSGMLADTWGAYRAFADFIAGAFIASAAMNGRWRLKSHTLAWLAMALAMVVMQLGAPLYLSYFMVVAALFLALVAETNAPERAQWLDALAPVAAVSFGIYMWHPVIEKLWFTLAWNPLLKPLGVNFYAQLILPAALTVAVAWISWRYFERPAANWLMNRFPGLARPRAPQPAE